jgi:hypothetical protein
MNIPNSGIPNVAIYISFPIELIALLVWGKSPNRLFVLLTLVSCVLNSIWINYNFACTWVLHEHPHSLRDYLNTRPLLWCVLLLLKLEMRCGGYLLFDVHLSTGWLVQRMVRSLEVRHSFNDGLHLWYFLTCRSVATFSWFLASPWFILTAFDAALVKLPVSRGWFCSISMNWPDAFCIFYNFWCFHVGILRSFSVSVCTRLQVGYCARFRLFT